MGRKLYLDLDNNEKIHFQQKSWDDKLDPQFVAEDFESVKLARRDLFALLVWGEIKTECLAGDICFGGRDKDSDVINIEKKN